MAEVYVFAAWSGTGKTAYLERLIPCLNQLGLTAAVVKHDVHGLALDRPGKDSHRLFHAGAEATAAVCGGEVLLHRRTEPTLEEVLALLPPTDLVLVEGIQGIPLSQDRHLPRRSEKTSGGGAGGVPGSGDGHGAGRALPSVFPGRAGGPGGVSRGPARRRINAGPYKIWKKENTPMGYFLFLPPEP